MTKVQNNPRKQRQQAEQVEIKSLAERTQDPTSLKNTSMKQFGDLPISAKTLKGLNDAGFTTMTDVQCTSLPFTLCGKDVLSAAKTGSGKTLAFLIPLLERLYRERWCNDDGFGALVLSPTRELAVQIFQVLREIGKQHAFSAGLIIGGKNLMEEKTRMARLNILIATPGRLLQHMHETPGFTADELQILVLDEADRILDMGFEKDVNAILDFIPTTRQTLLFSATQTKSVHDLARLSLKSPEYIAVHDIATSHQLSQAYIVTPLPKKLDLLWSFLKTHLQHKSIVFMTSCKQVRFVFEAFCKLKPGIPLRHLHGGQKQCQRLSVYDEFCRDKHAVLFTTDIAARGLDFLLVNWVVQLDVPESVETYIHRVGRTARYQSGGNALMFVLPSEEMGMLKTLADKAPTLRRLKVNPAKSRAIKPDLQALCTQFVDLKYLAQRAFVTYIKSVHLQKNKDVFDVYALPLDEYAESLGLPGKPKLRFIKKGSMKRKNHSTKVDDLSQETPETSENRSEKVVRTRVDRMLQRKNQDVLSAHYSQLIERSDNESESDSKGSDNSECRPGATSPRPTTSQRLLSSDSESDIGECQAVTASSKSLKNTARAHVSKESELSKLWHGGLPDPSVPSKQPTHHNTVENTFPGASQSACTQQQKPQKSQGQDDLLTIKRTNHQLDPVIDELKTVPNAALSHRRILRERVKHRKQLPPAEKLVFDDDGTPTKLYSVEDEKSFNARVGDIELARSVFLADHASQMKIEDMADKQVAKIKLRTKRLLSKQKERGAIQKEADRVVQHQSLPCIEKKGKRKLEDSGVCNSAKRIASDEALALQLLHGGLT